MNEERIHQYGCVYILHDNILLFVRNMHCNTDIFISEVENVKKMICQNCGHEQTIRKLKNRKMKGIYCSVCTKKIIGGKDNGRKKLDETN